MSCFSAAWNVMHQVDLVDDPRFSEVFGKRMDLWWHQRVDCHSRRNTLQIFHVFIEWGGNVVFAEMVYGPKAKDDFEKHSKESSLAGFHGCLGSSDATYIGMKWCSGHGSSWIMDISDGKPQSPTQALHYLQRYQMVTVARIYVKGRGMHFRHYER